MGRDFMDDPRIYIYIHHTRTYSRHRVGIHRPRFTSMLECALCSLRSFIGLGVGAGANVLLRFHLLAPHLTDALILVNCSAAAAGWLEWGSHQVRATRHSSMCTVTCARCGCEVRSEKGVRIGVGYAHR